MKILVLIDGSKWSQKAALHGIAVAKKKNAKLVLFSVLDRREARATAFNLVARHGDIEKVRRFEDEVWNKMKRDLQDVMSEILKFCHEEGVNCSIKIVEGMAKDKILEEANSGEYSLVVMGAYGKSGKTRIGSLLEEIAGNVKPPLLIVR
jgi:nucleotide-binding universal stress UspA family protein